MTTNGARVYVATVQLAVLASSQEAADRLITDALSGPDVAAWRYTLPVRDGMSGLPAGTTLSVSDLQDWGRHR